jgi:hypothetical protein
MVGRTSVARRRMEGVFTATTAAFYNFYSSFAKELRAIPYYIIIGRMRELG